MESKYESFTFFVLNVIKNNAMFNNNLSESEEQILELAEFLGLGNVHKIDYDPTIHENVVGDIGDKLWVFETTPSNIKTLETAEGSFNVE